MTDGPYRFVINGTCASTPRWATRTGSDAIGFVRGPAGSLNLVMIDVQGSGPGGTALAQSLYGFTSDLLRAGTTVQVALEAVNLHLVALRHGRVLASVLLASAPPEADALRILTAGKHVIGIRQFNELNVKVVESPMIGGLERSVPMETLLQIARGFSVILPNDGVAASEPELRDLLAVTGGNTVTAADVLSSAIARDSSRPRSDMAVATISLGLPLILDGIEHGSISLPTSRSSEVA
jgi:hypothetical protein